MNFCTKCDSYYQQPGTCNCYAPVVIVTTATPYPLPPPTGDEIPPPYETTCGAITVQEYGTIIDNNASGCTITWDPDDPNNPSWSYTVN